MTSIFIQMSEVRLQISLFGLGDSQTDKPLTEQIMTQFTHAYMGRQASMS